jgi:hypothetical protein
MAAGGHRYVVTADPGLDVPEPANPVVLDDVGWARQHGYGSRDQTRVREQTEADPNQRHVQSMPAAQREAYGRALLGSPTAGKLAVTLPNGLHLETADRSCLADADRRLYGDLPRWFASDSIASNLQPTVHDRLHRDPGFPPALTGWSACLATAGLRYATPTELQQATTQQVAGLPPEQAWAIETDHAAAEADCASRTGFGTFTRQLYHRYTQQVHAEYTGALQEQRQLRYHALITARPIVRHHPAGG